ncbi:MAG: hypothetical protein DMF49_13125 [Acidobacteria bacterium]|nr:MAG: hypothetical protein DMF49_13125 [Acidobacteriota bacterium]
MGARVIRIGRAGALAAGLLTAALFGGTARLLDAAFFRAFAVGARFFGVSLLAAAFLFGAPLRAAVFPRAAVLRFGLRATDFFRAATLRGDGFRALLFFAMDPPPDDAIRR